MTDGRTRRWALAAVATAMGGLLTGCSGEVDGGTTATATRTDTPNTDCPPTLTVYEARAEPVDETQAVAYENLTASQRRTFDRARNESVTAFDDAWYEIPVVSYRGTYYRASVAVC